MILHTDAQMIQTINGVVHNPPVGAPSQEAIGTSPAIIFSIYTLSYLSLNLNMRFLLLLGHQLMLLNYMQITM